MTTVTIDSVKYSLSGTVATVTGSSSPPNPWNLVIPSTVNNLGITYNVTSIAENAFRNLTILTSVTIPNSVTSIDGSAFKSCTSLTSITIPDSVTSIGDFSFTGCTGLINIIVNSYIINLGLVFFEVNNSNTSWVFDYSGSIPNGVCNGRSGVTNITIGNQITSISNVAFQSCTGLTTVTIPNSVTSIGEDVFQYCTGLTSVTIGNSVTSIGQYAFFNCTGLTSVTFLGLIPTIGANNFIITGDNVNYDKVLNTGNPNVAAMLAMFTTNTPICFPAGTPVVTDQGIIAIDKISPIKNTIRGKKIVAITKTVTLEDNIVCIEKDALDTNVPSQKTLISRNHKLFFNKQMIKAKHLIGQVDGVYNKKYNGEVLYNVLLETHEKMMVNNLIVETLDPTNVVAQLYNGSLTVEERNIIVVTINRYANEYKKTYSKLR